MQIGKRGEKGILAKEKESPFLIEKNEASLFRGFHNASD